MIQFLLNNQLVSEDALDPNLTVLNYLRTRQQRPGTKEGCIWRLWRLQCDSGQSRRGNNAV